MTDAAEGEDVNRRRVLQATAAGGATLAGLGATAGSAVADEDLDEAVEDADVEDADEGYFDACLGGLEEADDDLPEVSFRGYRRPSLFHDHGEEYNVPHGEDEILVYVHGWIRTVTGGARDQAATLKKALRQNGYDQPVIPAVWSSNTPNWWGIQNRADDAAARMADWIREYREANPETTIRLVGHSMGGHVSLQILNELDGEETIESVAMLGPSIDEDTVCEDGQFADGIEASTEEVHSYNSENDSILCTVYRLGEFGDRGVGCAGSDCDGGLFGSGSTPDNYEDVDVTDDVDGHCAYYRPDGQGCIDQVVDNFSDAGEGDDGEDDGDDDDGDDGGFWDDLF